VAWSTSNGTVKLVRTSASGTRFGGVRTMPKPAGATGVFQIVLEGSRNAVDVVVNGGNGLYHAQVLPAPNFSARPGRWPAGTAKKVVFTVKDAGVPVRGAQVRAKGKACTTSAAGTCSIRFPALRRTTVSATVTKSAYAKSTLKLKVR
jgi:hypothetical protein